MVFWEMYQQVQIAGAQHTANRAEGKALNTEIEMRRLHDRIDTLALTCQALWEMLRERTGLSDADIESRMQEIDLRDGIADGKMGHASTTCPACQRPISKRHQTCMYCGADLGSRDHVFKT